MKHVNHKTNSADWVPFTRSVAYGTGMLGYAPLIQIYMHFYNPVFNDTPGLNPILIGWAIFLSRMWDAVTDPLMGSISDNTRSRWERRRPWIILGAVLCSLVFLALWWFPAGQSAGFYFGWLLIASLFFFLSFTIFSVPYIALGMELSPDYHERTGVITIRTVIKQFGFFIVSSLFFLTSLDRFADRAEGMRFHSLWVAVVIFIVIAIPALFAREHPMVAAALERQDAQKSNQKIPLWISVKETLSCWPFLNLGLITIVNYIGVITVGSIGYHVTIYHLFGGNKSIASGKLMTIVGYSIPISIMISLPLINKLSKKIGKRNGLITAYSLTVIGALLRWPLYTPIYPYLSIIPTVLFGIGCAGAYVFINAMIPDAIDADELKTSERRESMFSAMYGWTFKIGAAAAILLSGYVLQWTEFDAALGANQAPETVYGLRFSFTWVAAVSLFMTVILSLTYPITEQRSHEIRAELEARRYGKES